MQNRKNSRIRRASRTRIKISELGIVRLSVHRTNSHIYAQLIDDKNCKTLTSASTLEPEVRKSVSKGSDVSAASLIGKRIAEKAKSIGIESIAFDRSGYQYHGRVKALADSARENGLKF